MIPIFKNPLTTLLTINDLAKKSFQYKLNNKSSIPILIIDDNSFVYEEEMRSRGYNIHCIHDLDYLEMAESYRIIISDIKGVGNKLQYGYEGVGLLHALKNKYPFKLYGVYTGNSVDLEIANLLEGVKIIPKNVDKDDWDSYLEGFVKDSFDPISIWKKLRYLLLSSNVTLYELVLMEHKYVDAVINNKPDISNLFDNDKRIPDDFRAIVNSMIANVITNSIM